MVFRKSLEFVQNPNQKKLFNPDRKGQKSKSKSAPFMPDTQDLLKEAGK